MKRMGGLLCVVVALSAACSGGDDASSESTQAPSTSTVESSAPSTEPEVTNAPTTDAPTTTAAETTTTVPPVPVVPAGVQYGAAETLPAEVGAYGDGVAKRDGVMYFVGRVLQDAAEQIAAPAIVVRQADGTANTLTIDDNSNYSIPGEFSYTRGFNVSDVAVSEKGIVAVGVNWLGHRDGRGEMSSQSLIWHSTDGVTFQRIDPRPLVGNIPLQLTNVAATPTGFLATGAVADAFRISTTKTDVAVLESPDGVNWRMMTRITSTWSLDPAAVGIVGDEVVVTGYEYACTADSGHLVNFSTGAQYRIWHSADAGATWQTLRGPDTGYVVEPEPAPTDPALCPAREGGSFLEENSKRFTAGPALSALTPQGLVLVATGGGRIGVSTDLTNWQEGELSHLLPTPVSDTLTPSGSRSLRAFEQGGDLVVTSVEPIRGPDNKQVGGEGHQVFSWRSSDGGVTWVEQLRARPLLLQSGSQVSVAPIDDDSTMLLDLGTLEGAAQFGFVSVAGDLVDYAACAAAPGADCSFAETLEGGTAGADLSGIDLRGARLGDTDFGGANLTGARLGGVTMDGSLAGANLTQASLVDARLNGADLSGAVLTGADLSGVNVNQTIAVAADLRGATLTGARIVIADGASLEGADFSGANLTRVGFSIYGSDLASMRNASFNGAIVDGATFSRVDLTGADFTNANLGVNPGLLFFFDAICPDGQPQTEGVTGAASCRLG